MRRETQNILLLLLGGALLRIALTGDYLRYVKPTLQPWLIGAALVTLGLGAVAAVRDVLAARRRARDSGADVSVPGDDGCPGHEHRHSARSAWLLVLPVLAIFFVAPPALGSDSVKRAGDDGGQSVPRSDSAFPPLPEKEVVALSVTEFVSRAGWDSAGSLTGRTVSLTGFVVHSGGEPTLARMVIGCCAADAYAVRVRLVGQRASVVRSLPDDTWIEVTGRVVPGTAVPDNGYRPDLTVATVTRTPAPRDQYE
ncbi:TIGR03943 family putative permease subunit [Saccharomonospora saliphila]|uniref:TIGR03943 family putative permease subunit n=1 Tax=Saccharomonospora saliphila TaxID=369829 RepID=UPI0003623633|nr:TIGR03943 family protein [Saccharomonospora saliphila]